MQPGHRKPKTLLTVLLASASTITFLEGREAAASLRLYLRKILIIYQLPAGRRGEGAECEKTVEIGSTLRRVLATLGNGES